MVKKLDVVDEKVKREPVAKGRASKRSLASRVDSAVFGSSGIKGTVRNIVIDTAIPVIKRAIVDTITGSVERIFYGENYVGRSRRDVGGRGYRNFETGRNYNTISQQKSSRSNSAQEIESILFDSRSEAQAVYNVMVDTIEEYGLVSVADYYELSDVSSKFIDHSFGWTRLDDVRIIQSNGGGYYLDLPRPKQI